MTDQELIKSPSEVLPLSENQLDYIQERRRMALDDISWSANGQAKMMRQVVTLDMQLLLSEVGRLRKELSHLEQIKTAMHTPTFAKALAAAEAEERGGEATEEEVLAHLQNRTANSRLRIVDGKRVVGPTGTTVCYIGDGYWNRAKSAVEAARSQAGHTEAESLHADR